jgi:DNA-binding NtrC family response regulator
MLVNTIMVTEEEPVRIIARGSPLASARVLVVGWDSVSSAYYEGILHGLGLKVLTRTSYTAGICCLERYEIALVILNQGSRAFEGGRMLEHLKGNHHSPPVIVLTRQYEPSIHLAAMSLGAVDYQREPVSVSKMAQLIKAHLGSRLFAE